MKRISILLKFTTLTLFMFVLLHGVAPASAHGYIVRAIPENRAVLDRAPPRLQYWFSEALERDFSELNVRDQNGEIIATGGVAENDNALMTVRLPSDLPDGAYIVELRPAFASDGHVVAESRVFFIGEEIGGVAGQAATDTAIPLEVAWRVIVYASTLILFGALTLYALVLVPAWGNSKYPAGLLPPRVMTRLNVIVGFALLGAFIGNGVALVQQTMVFFNIGFTHALDPSFWSLVRIGSRFGDIWNWRMMLLGGVGVMYLLSLYLRDTQPESVRAFWVANAWLMALILGTFSVLSHAAGSLLWPWVGVGVDWLHATGVGLWVGGLVALVLVLPIALQPYTGEARRNALLAALRRFSRLALVSALLVITTGIYSASNWIYSPDEAATSFGLSLGVKVLMVLLLLGVAALHHIALRPERYARYTAIIRRVSGFLPTLRLEAVLACVVLVGASWLTATPVPVPEFAQQERETPTEVQFLDDLTVVLTLLPGGPGVNTFDTTVTRDGQRVEGLQINMRKVHPADDKRGDWLQTEPAEAGLYVAASDDIDESGVWWTLLDITDESGETHRLAFDWEIDAEAAVIQSIDPSLVNIVALVAVIITVGWAIWPIVLRFLNVLNLDPASVAVAGLATVVAAVVLVGGYALIQETRTQYAETLDPPPQVVNAVLPTDASILRGQALFQASCSGWLNHPHVLDDLRERLPRTRDEDLFMATRDGWRDLPACDEDLSFFERWDIVNYFRTLEAIENSN